MAKSSRQAGNSGWGILVLLVVTFAIAGAMATGAPAQTINRCAIRPHTVCVRRNLAGAKLAGARLAYANLTGANLSHANLRGADLRGAVLTGAKFTGADLRGARFGVGAKLSAALLSSANLTGQQLVAADLRHGVLIGSKLVGANLTRTRLGGANLTGADLTNAVVTGADMTGANLHGATLTGVSLAHVTVGGTKSGSITRPPSAPPPGYVVAGGFLLRVLPTPRFEVAATGGALTVAPFSSVPGASAYIVQLCDGAGANCQAPLTVGTSGMSFTGLTGGRTYVVTLVAKGDGVTSADSATASQHGTPTAIDLAAPGFGLTSGPATLTLDAFAAVPHATGYSAQLCEAAGTNCTAPTAVTTAGTTFPGLVGGTTYTVKLVALGDGVVYASSAAVSHAGIPTAVALASPVLSVTPGPGVLTLNAFAAVANATGYTAQLCDASGTVCGAPAAVATGGRTFLGLGGGNSYTVRLTAVGDGVAFADSAPATDTGTPTAVRLPTPVFTLTPGVGSLVLNPFTAIPNASGYSAQLCNGVGANCASPVPVTSAGMTFPGLPGGAVVTVRLSATGDGVAFANSSVATQTGTPGAVVLAAPSITLTAAAGTLRLDPFASVPNAAGYVAQVCDHVGANCAAAISVTTAGTTFSGLSGGVAYRVSVTATGDGVAFANSPAATQTGTPAAVPLPVPAFSLTAGPGTLTLNGFTAVPGASGYSAQVCTSAGTGCRGATAVTTSGTTFTGLAGGTTYRVTLVATGDGAASSDSIAAVQSGTPAPVRLPAPTFSVTSGVSSLVLNGFPAVPNASGYSAQLCNAAGTGCGNPVAVSSAGRTFSGLAGGTTYTLKLIAVGDEVAFVDSPAAAQPATAASFGLAAPAFTLTPGAGTLILNSFAAIPNASGYSAQLCNADGTACAGAMTVTPAGTTFTGLVGGAQYLVRLIAVGDGAAYANSPATTQTARPAAVVLTAPGVTVIPGPGALTLAPFTAVSGAVGYSAQLCDAAGAHCQPPVVVTTAGTTFAGLAGGTTYTVEVTATGDGVASSDSATVSRTATPTAVALPAPAFVVSSGAGTLTLNGFAAVPAASGYSAQLCNAAGANCGTPVIVTTSGYSFSALTGGTTYLIKLTAHGDGVAFLDSAVTTQTGTPGAVILPAPAFSLTPGAGRWP